jgi:outer membrane receptor protein involved in Fe transport
MKFSCFSFFLVVLFLAETSALAQQKTSSNSLKGRIVDSSAKSPLDFVNVALFSVKDSLITTGGITNEKGDFEIISIPNGTYFLRLKFIGYEEKYVSNIHFDGKTKVLDLGVLLLRNASSELNEVVIEVERKMLETSIDKRVFNVEEDLSTRGGSANDVLNNVPSIDIDQDGQISLRGNSNVTILIDGRPSSLSGSSRSAILEAIPAASIERIEVVTNPSAKYDPDGMSGIINIVLKKNKLRGFNGNVDATYGTGDSYTTSAGINLRNNKFNVFANYSYQYNDGYRNFYSTRIRSTVNGEETLLQERMGSDFREGHTAKTGFDYTIKEGHIIGTSLTFSNQNRNRSGVLVNDLSYNGGVSEIWLRNSEEPRTNETYDANLNYQWTFKEKKGDLLIDITQSVGSGTLLADYNEYEFENYTNSTSLIETLNNPSSRSVFTGMLDVVRNLKNSIRLETGAKAIINAEDNTQYREIFDFDSQLFYPDLGINNQFKLTENIFAAYGILGQQIKRFKYQVGLRAEQALVRPELKTTNEIYKNDYFSLFPSAHFAYELKEKTELFFSYSRRINRPSAHSLNPFTEYSDPFNLRTGNPALRPEYINSFEAGYNKSWKKLTVNSTGYYRYSTDVIQRVMDYFPDGTAATTYENLDNTHNYGIEGIIIYRPYSWWRTNFSTNMYQSVLVTSNPNLMNNSGFNWGFKVSSSLDFWKKTTTLQLNARYNAPRIVPQGIVQFKPSIEASLQRSFLDKKLAVTLRVSDIFDTQGFYMMVETPTVSQERVFKWQTRRVFITLSYKFGKLEMANDSKRKRTSSSGGGDMEF